VDDRPPLIVDTLEAVPQLDVRLYGPTGAPVPAAMVVATDKPRMSLARAVMMTLLHRYLRGERGSRRRSSRTSRRTLECRLYSTSNERSSGPYAEKLNHVLGAMEGHLTIGFGDRSGASDLRVVDAAIGEAQDFLDERPEMIAALDRVAALVDDFDSPYGLELLSTVHWVIQRGGVSADDGLSIAGAVRSWSERKNQLFTDHHVLVPRDRLVGAGWIDAPEPARAAIVG
jgi:hypothetical protein